MSSSAVKLSGESDILLMKRGTLRYTLAMNGFVAVLLRDGMCAVPEMTTALLTIPITGTVYFM